MTTEGIRPNDREKGNAMEKGRPSHSAFRSIHPSLLRATLAFRAVSNRSIVWRYTPMQLWPAWVKLWIVVVCRPWTRLRRAPRTVFDSAVQPTSPTQRTRLRRIGLAGFVLSLAAVGAIAQFKYYLWPKRFCVVEPGQIYRGGWQTPIVLRRILHKYQIKTLLNVACNPTEPEAAGEGTVVREAGVTWHKILMPGTGMATLAQLEEAADLLADPTRRPIFIHCAAGVHRTNMCIAAFRLKHCGWTLDATIDEMVKNGYDHANDMAKETLLRKYIERLHESGAPKNRELP